MKKLCVAFGLLTSTITQAGEFKEKLDNVAAIGKRTTFTTQDVVEFKQALQELDKVAHTQEAHTWFKKESAHIVTCAVLRPTPLDHAYVASKAFVLRNQLVPLKGSRLYSLDTYELAIIEKVLADLRTHVLDTPMLWHKYIIPKIQAHIISGLHAAPNAYMLALILAAHDHTRETAAKIMAIQAAEYMEIDIIS